MSAKSSGYRRAVLRFDPARQALIYSFKLFFSDAIRKRGCKAQKVRFSSLRDWLFARLFRRLPPDLARRGEAQASDASKRMRSGRAQMLGEGSYLFVPESAVLSDLRELERRVDLLLQRKRTQLITTAKKGSGAGVSMGRLRLYLSSQQQEDSWSFHVQGRVIDPLNEQPMVRASWGVVGIVWPSSCALGGGVGGEDGQSRRRKDRGSSQAVDRLAPGRRATRQCLRRCWSGWTSRSWTQRGSRQSWCVRCLCPPSAASGPDPSAAPGDAERTGRGVLGTRGPCGDTFRSVLGP